MSRARTRATRDETRASLFAAAARVFAERGIGASTIDAIAGAAGLTRGAFYSNFATKDELIIAMLEDHVAQSLRHHRDLLARHRDPVDFLAALRAASRSPQDPLGREPLLHMELILFVARAEQGRPELAKRLRARRALVTEVVASTSQTSPGRDPVDPAWAGAMLLALEDGFRLHRLIDPASTPADSFVRAVGELQRAIGLDQPAARTPRTGAKVRGVQRRDGRRAMRAPRGSG